MRRRAAAGEVKAHNAVAAGEYVPVSMLEATRSQLGGELERRTRALRSARRTEDELVRVLSEIRAITEPATVQHYQGGHRAHVAAVNAKARAVLEKYGAGTSKAQR